MAIVLGGVLGACGGDKGSDTESGATEGTSTGVTEGTSAGGAEWRRICDGSQELRLAVRVNGNEFVQTTSIAHELGTSYLYVRGDCRYWVASRSRPSQPSQFHAENWQLTRTGVLTPELEQALSLSLLYDRWPAVAGDYGSLDEGASNYLYSDGEASLRCSHDCSWGVDPPLEFAGVNEAARGWFESLWDAGEPMAASEPVAIELIAPVVESDLPVTETWTCAVPWPFALDPASISHDGQTHVGPIASRPIVDPALAAELRALRDAQFADEPPDACNPLLISDSWVFFLPSAPNLPLLMWIRDRLPLEAEDGGVPLPPPPPP